MEEVVWLKEQRRFGILVQWNAHYSIVSYREDGVDYEVEIENDDYDLWSERAIDYESD